MPRDDAARVQDIVDAARMDFALVWRAASVSVPKLLDALESAHG
jgi:hypothetical protein